MEVNDLLSDNWIVGNLQSAFDTWNGKLAEIWSLVTASPETFRGGAVWSAILRRPARHYNLARIFAWRRAGLPI